MAKIENGYLGGFRGRLGPAVGYLWNGKWCLRSRPGNVRNPRTDKQIEHRAMFRQEVQLAARMRWAVLVGLTDAARLAGMTSYNLFVSINQPAFGAAEGSLTVDWSQLQLSLGPVAPVRLGSPVVEANGRLSVAFERNPMHLASSPYDEVRLYVYSPALGRGFLTASVHRRDQRLAALLPDGFAAGELHLYTFVADRQGRLSPTAYAGWSAPEPAATAPAAPADGATQGGDMQAVDAAAEPAEAATDTPPAADAGRSGDGRADPAQLSLW